MKVGPFFTSIPVRFTAVGAAMALLFSSVPAQARPGNSFFALSDASEEDEISWGPTDPLPAPSPSGSATPGSPQAVGPGQDREPAPGRTKSSCGEFDPDCRYAMERIFSGIRIAEPTVEAGVRFGQSGANAAVRISLETATWDLHLGDIGILTFDANILPDAGGFRLRITALDSEALFFCPLTAEEGGGTGAPLSGITRACRPEGVWALGGKFIEYQQDFGSSRWNARWLEVNALANLLKNAFSRDYIKKHILAQAGLGAESGGGESLATYFALRGNLGISGVFRSENERLELRAYAGFRPNLIEWDDWAAEARFEALVHFLLSPRVIASLGLKAEYSHWSRPERSLGNFASGTDPDTAFVGLLFGVQWR